MSDINIVLIGFMGVGKSTVSEYLGKRYSMKTVEMDQIIEERKKMSIPDIFKTYGEEYFRDLETELLKELQSERNVVISCGGGTALRECNVAEMKKNGRVVLLTASPKLIYSRVKDIDDRPVLYGRKTVEGISELMEERREKYEAAADIVIQTDNKSVSTICEELMHSLTEMEE
ncbi:MAG: shikimate kinase [Dorea sp.]|nr:shikimate kinase [Dorea sp.]